MSQRGQILRSNHSFALGNQAVHFGRITAMGGGGSVYGKLGSIRYDKQDELTIIGEFAWFEFDR